jgi:hypothetical protein
MESEEYVNRKRRKQEAENERQRLVYSSSSY